MKNYIIDKNRIIDENGNILIESSNIEQLKNVLNTINDLKTKLEYDNTSCYTKFKLNEDMKNNSANVVFVDVNFLKKVNDKYGHSKGDDLLINVVNILKKFGDVYRQGGDEFILLIEDDKILAKFVNEYKNTKMFSYGICSKAEFENIGQACRIADKRMYEHKQNQHLENKEFNIF